MWEQKTDIMVIDSKNSECVRGLMAKIYELTLNDINVNSAFKAKEFCLFEARVTASALEQG